MENVITHYDLTEIRNMDRGDIFALRTVMLKYIIFKSNTTGTLPSFNKIQQFFIYIFFRIYECRKEISNNKGKIR